ncbi:hypothetical protein [Kosmotoga pacifica]|uniref:PNPLA domain-containing protein n=1 Tax=Kosmotoga pacifica TaxID=1330330 RepID=A0A0G2ZE49_9BACT|nr:hypothetical protein [Kosmotoga pacifica]AKI97834.1 hypothetical protein IX53_08455 [Kosmotoga pacifica]
MKLHAGGFGLSGLMAIPYIRQYLSEDESPNIVSNGIAGLYAVSFLEFGKARAKEVVLDFLKDFEEPLKIMERSYSGYDKKMSKKREIEYCVKWTTSDHVAEWKDFYWFGKFSDTTHSAIYLELIDLLERKVLLFNGPARKMAQAAVAFPGLFQPFESRYINTTYYTQIPVVFAEDGDTVLLNFRIPREKPLSANQLLTHILELKGVTLAKEILHRKKVKILRMEDRVTWETLEDEDFLVRIFDC